MSTEEQKETFADKAKEGLASAATAAKAQIDALKTKEGRDALKDKAKEGFASAATTAKEQIAALKTKEGREFLKTKIKAFWGSGIKGKSICVGGAALLLLTILPLFKSEAGKAEIDFVKKSPFENNSLIPIGVALERNAKSLQWKLDESEAGIKFVEATGEFTDKGRVYCIAHHGADNNVNFYKAIPELAELLWGNKEENRAFWDGGFSMIPDKSRISRFYTAAEEMKKGKKDVLGEYNGHKIHNNAEFNAALTALKKAIEDEKESSVLFKIQFPMLVSNYDSNGKFDREKAVCKQGYSSIQFTKGPLAGVEIECDLLPAIK